MVRKDEEYDDWRFQFVAYLTAVDPRFGEVADDAARRTMPFLLTDLPPHEEGQNASLMLCSDHRGLHQEQICAPDHGNGKP